MPVIAAIPEMLKMSKNTHSIKPELQEQFVLTAICQKRNSGK